MILHKTFTVDSTLADTIQSHSVEATDSLVVRLSDYVINNYLEDFEVEVSDSEHQATCEITNRVTKCKLVHLWGS